VEPLLLGVDGGNTKTIALVARRDGTVLGAGRVLACSDIHATTPETAMAVVTGAVDEALSAAGIAVADASYVASGFSMAGADWPEDIELLRALLGSTWPNAVVVNDAIGALRAAIPEGPGVTVVAGTGTATGARGPDGRTWHTSFWQEPQAARDLGERTLRAVYRADLGIDPPTALTRRVLDALGARDVESILHRRTMRGPGRWREPDALAALLLDAADAGDPTAVAIVRGHGAALGAYALAAARRVGIRDEPFGLALTGGVFRHAGRELRDATVAAVRAGASLVEEVRPSLEPVAGALLLAFDVAGIEITSAIDERLRATLPAGALFETHRAAAIVE
jgi:N-acetylglucosamine kinase-like BadF-type ATPase